MNVLKFMRSSAILKYLLWLVILSFIIWIFAFYGGGRQTSNKGLGQDYVVKVRSKTLPPETLTLAMQFQRERIRSMLGEEYVEQLMKDAPRTISNSLVDALIFEYLSEEYGIGVSETEVADSIMKAFRFTDPASQYDMMLKTRGVSAIEFEALWKTDLTRRKLLSFIASGFVFGDQDLETRFKDANNKFKAKIVAVNARNFAKDAGEISDAEAMAVFEREKATLAIPERRDLKYYLVSAPAMRNTLEVPESEMKEYYEAHKERFGSKPYEQMKTQIKNVVLFSDKKYQEKAKQVFEAASAEFNKAGNEAELAAFASKYNLQISHAEGLDKNRAVPPFVTEPELLDQVFAANANEWSQIYQMPMSTIRFCVTKVTSPHPATFDEVKEDIKKRLKDEKVSAMVRKAASELKMAAKDIKTFEEEAKKRSFQVQDTAELKMDDALPFVGKDKSLCRRIFDGTVAQVSGPFETKDGCILAYLMEKNPADMEKFRKEKTSFAEGEAQKDAQNYLDDYVTRKRLELEAKGQISVNQEILKKYEPQTGS